MTGDRTLSHPTAPMTATFAAQESRRRASVAASDRLVRQIQNTDAWIAARREREQALSALGISREQRLEANREIEALRRTHDVIKGRCARGLADPVGLMRPPGLTAVIAHRHPWFTDKISQLLSGYGVTVLACTDNGADALAAVVTEQPDVLIAGDRLGSMSGHALLSQARPYAPNTLLAAQVPDHEQDLYETVADTVFLGRHQPGNVADALVVRLTSADEPSRHEVSAAEAFPSTRVGEWGGD